MEIVPRLSSNATVHDKRRCVLFASGWHGEDSPDGDHWRGADVWGLVRFRNDPARKVIKMSILEVGIPEAIGRLKAPLDVARVGSSAAENVWLPGVVSAKPFLLARVHRV